MTHDKKNESKEINFTLLSDIGEIQINQTASRDEIYETLDWIYLTNSVSVQFDFCKMIFLFV